METLGYGTICPRCLGGKPAGDIGPEISISRRGKAAICSACGTEEALVDMTLSNISYPIPSGIKAREERLTKAFLRRALPKKVWKSGVPQ